MKKIFRLFLLILTFWVEENVLAQNIQESNSQLAFMAENAKPSSPEMQKAIENLEKMADKGNAEAQAKLGLMYEFGLGGVNKDIKKAMLYFEKAAKQGHSKAIQRLDFLKHQN